MSCKCRLLEYRGNAVWDLESTAPNGRPHQLFLSHYPTSHLDYSVALRPGMAVEVLNALAARMRGKLLGLTCTAFSSLSIVSTSPIKAPSVSPEWFLRENWRSISNRESVWLLTELLPKFEQKFAGVWNSETLLGPMMSNARQHPKARAAKGVLYHVLSCMDSCSNLAYQFTKQQSKKEEFFSCGVPTGQQKELPYTPTIAETWSACKSIAESKACRPQLQGWSYYNVTANDIARCITEADGWSASTDAAVLVLIGRLGSSTGDGTLELSDQTGSIRVCLNPGIVPDAWMANHIWMFSEFSLKVEIAAKHRQGSPDRFMWYLSVDFSTATCLFSENTPIVRGLDSSVISASASEPQHPRSLRFIVSNKSTLAVRASASGPILCFHLDVQLLPADGATPSAAAAASGTGSIAQIFVSGKAVAMYHFVQLFETYQVSGPLGKKEVVMTEDTGFDSTPLPAMYELCGDVVIESLRFESDIVAGTGGVGSDAAAAAAAGVEDGDRHALSTAVRIPAELLLRVQGIQHNLKKQDSETIRDVQDVLLRPRDRDATQDAFELLSFRGVIRERSVQVSDNERCSLYFGLEACSPLAYMQGLQIQLRVQVRPACPTNHSPFSAQLPPVADNRTVSVRPQQMGGMADECVDVYFDMLKHLAPAGMLPGATVTFRNIGKHVAWKSGRTYCRFLPTTSITVRAAASSSSSELAAAHLVHRAALSLGACTLMHAATVCC